jgi:transposase
MSRTEFLTDSQWALIAPMMPSATVKGGRPFQDHRRVVEGIIYRYRTGIPWRDLPESFGPWQTVWKRHRRFSGDGTWNSILTELLSQADEAELIQWEVSVDSTVNRAHQHGTNLARTTGGPIELHEFSDRAS